MTSPTPEEIAAIAREVTEAQRTCGDVLDQLPCPRCGAMSLRTCPVPMSIRGAAGRLINNTPGLMNHLRRHLEQERAK